MLQRALVMALESVYEQDFRDCSFGFRPGRSAHDALQTLWEQTMAMGGGWVIDLDIQGFFDVLDHRHLRGFLDQRVRDGVLRRAIDKWLKAGVLEDGRVSRSASGTPQGGVVSPLLANIYLHHVLDVWFTTEVQPRLRGRSVLVRYADDMVIVIERESDAHRVLAVLSKRLGRFGLTMHPEKSRLVRFRRPRFGWRPGQDGDGFPPPGTFNFLGFTHYWGIARNGGWVLKRKTAKDRLRRSLTAINRWCGAHRHASVAEQHRMLVWKLRGHCAYYGTTGNAPSLSAFGFHVVHIWQKWLNRRSQKRAMLWTRFLRLLVRYPLPRMTVMHSTARASRSHLSRSRMRKNPPVRVCGGLGSATTLVYPTALSKNRGKRYQALADLRTPKSSSAVATPAQSDMLSIAVLPCVNMSAGPDLKRGSGLCHGSGIGSIRRSAPSPSSVKR